MDTRINNPNYSLAKSIHEFTVPNLKGELIKLDSYKGFICVIVNIATNSTFTEQNYKHFNELMDLYGDKLRILAFPCHQFGEEPVSEEEIASHAEKNNVKFDIFAKVEVNGEEASDLWKFLKWIYLMDPDEVTRQLAMLLNRKYIRRRRHNHLHITSTSNLTLSSINGARLNQALASLNVQKRTTSLRQTHADTRRNIPKRRKRKESRF